jgi:UDP-2,3-diacylglucosamine pyrophosphatase LpxH
MGRKAVTLTSIRTRVFVCRRYWRDKTMKQKTVHQEVEWMNLMGNTA